VGFARLEVLQRMLVAVFEADTRPPRWPWVSAALAGVWLAVFAAGAGGSPTPADHFGLWPDSLWGHTLFAIFLALAIGGGAAATLWTSPNPARPLVGASAALAALVAAATMRVRRRGLTLRIGFGRRASFDVWLPAFALPVAWLGGIVLVRATDPAIGPTAGLDLRIQLGLAAAGALLAGMIGWSGLEERWLRGRERAARERVIASHIARARSESDAGRPEVAFELLEASLDAFPDPSIVSVMLEVGSGCGRQGDALACGAHAVGKAWHAGQRELATALWTPLVRTEPDLQLDMRLRLALAPILKAAGLAREAALTLRGELRGKRNALTPGSALRIADAARALHPPTAIEAARIALESDRIDARKRARIEALIDALEADPSQLVALDLDPDAEEPPPRRRKEDPPPADPQALALPEAADALDLDAPGSGGTEPDTEDPYALVLDPEADGEPTDPER
jgi:hypothetical protein